MTALDGGLDLESFLLLLRADLGAWALIGLGTLVLGLLLWLSWGSRRPLRKCLALSFVAHAGLALYGGTVPSVFRALGSSARDPSEPHIRQIRVTPVTDRGEPPSRRRQESSSAPESERSNGKTLAAPIDSVDVVCQPFRLADSSSSPALAAVARTRPIEAFAVSTDLPGSAPKIVSATPSIVHSRSAPPDEPLSRDHGQSPGPPPSASGTASLTESDLAELVPPEPPSLAQSGSANRRDDARSHVSLLPAADLRRRPVGQSAAPAVAPGPSVATDDNPIPLVRAMPSGADRAVPRPALAALAEPAAGRVLTEVPRFYRSRLDANRSSLATRSGATAASEQAVEKALDWLARHQDADGRWDGATARDEDGTALPGDDDFTVFCPPGQTCFGECAYWEADSALTGLALLTYLGAGYTHQDGKFATTVSKGLEFLLSQQKADGDLRGQSRAVGMYCHAMATLALCEAYALSLEERLREPAERAVAFLIRGRARDGQAWRYLPGATVGDTSILGWVVMALKSAREVGLRIPDLPQLDNGTLQWLDRVATGSEKGLARYQPWEPVTPTMTAEAWVCRQFLGAGGPGAASTEAADYLLQHPSDKGDSNYYYWYYGTLAMYQHGGQPWTRWNGRIRDRIVSLQRNSGHPTGSWDPDDSIYGARGGRIYCTALAALSLEVYYRYLRLYGEPKLPADAKAGEPSGPALEAPRPR
ncbi:MAG: hypothetical protein ACLP7Q_23185 [Isosphaeraceae bacterium]